MKLQFGDLPAKADLVEKLKAGQKFEEQVSAARVALGRLQRLPPLEAGIREYPPVIWRLGLDVCREANRRQREP